MIDSYEKYLKIDKKMSENTVAAYRRDIIAFDTFLKGRGVFSLEECTNSDVVAYLMDLKNENKSKSTVNRKLASLRAYYKYLMQNGIVSSNPTDDIKSPRIERKGVEYLSIEEVDRLLFMPDDTTKGIRDKALLELMYATGIRVTEVIDLMPEDVNLRMGFITCTGEHGKARIVPIGSMAKKAVDTYLTKGRDNLIMDSKENKPLFLNYFGQKLTRQGVWKILKKYGEAAGIEEKITPQILRNSFAAHMIQNGADLKSLQELLGHEDIIATQFYLSVKKTRIKDVYDKTHPRA